jgi:phi13 family phage major tail protein
MAANGKVITGFSDPYVALYANSGTSVTYTSTTVLARGVSVSITPDDVGDDNIFYADNQPAEYASAVFKGADLTLTVDGMLDAARDLVLGLPTATAITVGTGTVNVTEFGDSQSIPYIGVGFVVRYMSDGQTSYGGVVLNKCKIKNIDTNAATQEEDIDWQTQELTGRVLRSDDANHTWRMITEDLSTQTEAVNAVKVLLGGTI